MIEDNLTEIIAEFEDYTNLRSTTGSVMTNVEYALAVEDGSTRKIELKNPRKTGVTPKPSKKSKGIAEVVYTPTTTTISTAGAHMFENSKEPVADFAAKEIVAQPLTQRGLKMAISESVRFAKKEIMQRTPVDTSRLINSYKEHLPK